jgi:hypothetical protein
MYGFFRFRLGMRRLIVQRLRYSRQELNLAVHGQDYDDFTCLGLFDDGLFTGSHLSDQPVQSPSDAKDNEGKKYPQNDKGDKRQSNNRQTDCPDTSPNTSQNRVIHSVALLAVTLATWASKRNTGPRCPCRS